MTDSSNSTTADEPRCPECGYVLLGLPEHRCPECGTPFDLDGLQYLLPWERRESGRWVTRLFRTILGASIHPGRYFAAASQRKNRRIAHAGSLVAASAGMSFALLMVVEFLYNVAFFVRMTVRHGSPQLAFDTTIKLLRVPGWSVWLMSAPELLYTLLSVFLVAAFLTRLFRRRVGSFRMADVAALFSPVAVLGMLPIALRSALLATLDTTEWMEVLIFFVYAAEYSFQAALLLFVWHGSRKLLSLSRSKTVATVIVCGLIQWAASYAFYFVFIKLLW